MRKRIAAAAAVLVLAAAAGTAGIMLLSDRKAADAIQIYGVNTEGTALVEMPYDPGGLTGEEAVSDLLDTLTQTAETDVRPAIPNGVEVQDYTLEGEKLTLDFNTGYTAMDTVQEVLCRAAVVRSMTRLDQVDMVRILVDSAPLVNENGKEYGFMQEDDFVQNTGSAINSFEETKLCLYFADEKGTGLVKEVRKVRFNTSLSKEKLVVEQLMKGPSQEGSRSVIPEGTKLLDVSVKDDVCYVNFDEGINNSIAGVTPEVIIYAVVNSLADSTPEGRIQISVDGETNREFQESVEIGHPLTRNARLLEAVHNE